MKQKFCGNCASWKKAILAWLPGCLCERSETTGAILLYSVGLTLVCVSCPLVFFYCREIRVLVYTHFALSRSWNRCDRIECSYTKDNEHTVIYYMKLTAVTKSYMLTVTISITLPECYHYCRLYSYAFFLILYWEAVLHSTSIISCERHAYD